jgi:2-polyprenyl-3-methyl-5-hydroxy-6-metoxy-1,4-benzoquinol methylase
MANEKLKIVSVENKAPTPAVLPPKSSRRAEIKQEMEALWQEDPRQFDPNRDAMQRNRIANTFSLIQQLAPLQGKRVADLGTGFGVLACKCREAGAYVDAVDIASQPLEKLRAKKIEGITPLQECMPATSLKDDFYDLVLCTEMVGYLKPKEYRIAISELSRIVKKEGRVVCSTPLDLKSDDALERFLALFETEFTICATFFSYDFLLLKLCSFFEAPSKIVKNAKSPVLKKQSRWRSKALYSKPSVFVCRLIGLLFEPATNLLRQSEWIRNRLEKLSRLLWQQSGISHVIVAGERHPLNFPLPKKELPQEPKHKREVWE